MGTVTLGKSTCQLSGALERSGELLLALLGVELLAVDGPVCAAADDASVGLLAVASEGALALLGVAAVAFVHGEPKGLVQLRGVLPELLLLFKNPLRGSGENLADSLMTHIYSYNQFVGHVNIRTPAESTTPKFVPRYEVGVAKKIMSGVQKSGFFAERP